MNRRAFTLIEMLLATMLIGILTAFSIMTFQAVSRGWQVSADYLDKSQRTDYALGQVVSGLRSMYYSHEGKQDERYGFMLTNNGDGESPRESDVIEWSKTGPAIVGTKNSIADTVHRVQLMVLEEGDSKYGNEPIEKTGLYARLCRDAALIPTDETDETDLTFGNDELYRPLLIADGIVGFNCRVLKDAQTAASGAGKDSANDKRKFEDEFAESNAVPYKVELTFWLENPNDEYRSQSTRAPMVRIIRLPIHEQSLDGAMTPEDQASGEKGKTNGRGKGK